ncbi:hypothetical protein DL96DRAFT_913688 [Flagelloscypha sp. PMI_526]|nr:hypothetical protein DL96DRAFT_913688 [Flagelloscypha sp. PMI_526]
MVVCRFFLNGTCSFGDNCRNEHPKDGQQGSFGNSSWRNPSSSTTTSTLKKTGPAAVEAVFTYARLHSSRSHCRKEQTYVAS